MRDQRRQVYKLLFRKTFLNGVTIQYVYLKKEHFQQFFKSYRYLNYNTIKLIEIIIIINK